MSTIITVLMIDDDKDNFDSLKNKAALKGIQLKYAESLEDMLDELKINLEVDAVILDGKGFRKIEKDICPTIPARARKDGSGQPVINVYSLQPRTGDPTKGGTGLLQKSNESYCLDTGNSMAIEFENKRSQFGYQIWCYFSSF